HHQPQLDQKNDKIRRWIRGDDRRLPSDDFTKKERSLHLCSNQAEPINGDVANGKCHWRRESMLRLPRTSTERKPRWPRTRPYPNRRTISLFHGYARRHAPKIRERHRRGIPAGPSAIGVWILRAVCAVPLGAKAERPFRFRGFQIHARHRGKAT